MMKRRSLAGLGKGEHLKRHLVDFALQLVDILVLVDHFLGNFNITFGECLDGLLQVLLGCGGHDQNVVVHSLQFLMERESGLHNCVLRG